MSKRRCVAEIEEASYSSARLCSVHSAHVCLLAAGQIDAVKAELAWVSEKHTLALDKLRNKVRIDLALRASPGLLWATHQAHVVFLQFLSNLVVEHISIASFQYASESLPCPRLNVLFACCVAAAFLCRAFARRSYRTSCSRPSKRSVDTALSLLQQEDSLAHIACLQIHKLMAAEEAPKTSGAGNQLSLESGQQAGALESKRGTTSRNLQVFWSALRG
jgi:hypothetical protein